MRIKIKRKEKSIETAFARWVGKLDRWVTYKFSPDGTRGLPDRIVLGPGKTVFFIEFKRPGEKPTPLQLYRHDLLKDLGFDVYVCDDWREAQKILRSYVRT